MKVVENAYILVGILKERVHLGELGTDGRTILKWILRNKA
jgi:hypothetical protein